jgi:hypothetical protein
MTTDASGNVLITGEYSSTSIDFGGGTLVHGAGTYNAFLAKFDAAGAHQWSYRFTGPSGSGGTYGAGVATDSSGNVVFTGSMYGAVDFGGGALPYSGSGNSYLVKYDGAGNHLWSQSFADGTPQGIAMDGSDNVLLLVEFAGTVDFGGGPLVSAGSTDMAIAKFDSAGNHLWSARFGDSDIQRPSGITTDSFDNVLVTGEFRGTVDFGGGPLVAAGLGTLDIFLVKFDSGGSHVWSRQFGDTLNQWGRQVAVDPWDSVLLAVYFEGGVDFGGGVLTSGGDQDAAVAKFDASGNHLWSAAFGGTGMQKAFDVAADDQGNLLLAGYFRDSLDFGGGILTSAGGNDVFLARFTPGGSHLWSAGYGDNETQYAYDVEITSGGRAYLLGGCAGSLDLGGGPLTCEPGGEDVYLAQFSLQTVTDVPISLGPIRSLGPSYPNPIQPETTIPFALGHSGTVDMTVYDVSGRRVATVLREYRSTGRHTAHWDGRNSAGEPVEAGVYFVRLSSRSATRSEKLVVLP